MTVSAMNVIPVLMYHHIAPHPGDTVTVRPEVFAGQMELLKKGGYRFLSADELVDHLTGASPVRERAVAITMDDGWLDNYLNAYPVLAGFGIKATIFVITGRTDAASIAGCHGCAEPPRHEEAKGHIGEGRAERVVLDWETVRTMASGGLIGFYSHTVSHRRCADLEPPDLLYELTASKMTLERELARSCDYLCWPYGSFTDEAVRTAGTVGYRAIFTTIDGLCLPGTDPLRIPRIDVRDSVDWLRTRLEEASLFSIEKNGHSV